MPGRRGPPTPEISGACASAAAARVPVDCPAPGCVTMPAGLSTTRTWASSKTTRRGIDSAAISSESGGGTSARTRSPALKRGAGLRLAPSHPARPSPGPGVVRGLALSAGHLDAPLVDQGLDARAGELRKLRSEPEMEPPARLGRAHGGRHASGGLDGHVSEGVTVSMWRASSATPTLIAESATLKAGQCQPRQ